MRRGLEGEIQEQEQEEVKVKRGNWREEQKQKQEREKQRETAKRLRGEREKRVEQLRFGGDLWRSTRGQQIFTSPVIQGCQGCQGFG